MLATFLFIRWKNTEAGRAKWDAITLKIPVVGPWLALGKSRNNADADLSKDRTSNYVFDWDRMLEAQGNTVPVVVMTAWGNVDLAVEAMRRGACDFVQKPWDNNRLLATIRKQAEPVRRRKSELTQPS